MERIYSFDNMTPVPPDPMTGSKIKLRNGHLWIEGELAKQTIGDTRQVYAVFYPNLRAILLAPDSDETFRAAHEVIMLFVKTKNSHGDKSISIQEFMADHDEIDDSDRDLSYMSAPGLSIIHITI
jgi:hypothetical protein